MKLIAGITRKSSVNKEKWVEIVMSVAILSKEKKRLLQHALRSAIRFIAQNKRVWKKFTHT